MAFLPMALMVGGTALSAASAYQQGRYQNAMSKYQARVSEQDANEQLMAGAEEEASFRKKARAQWGTNIRNIGMSGVTMTGSPLLVMSEIAEETELEANNIRRTGQVQANRSLSNASAYRISGKNAYQQGIMGAGATLMQGGSKVYGMGVKKGYWGN